MSHTHTHAHTHTHTHHIGERPPAGFSLTAVCGCGGGRISLHLEIADVSDVSSTLRVRLPWAARVAEARTWPKWANPLHVSPRPVSREIHGPPLKL